MKRYLRATVVDELAPLDGGGFDGVAFGAEFCHRRLPTVAQVRRARKRCRSLGVGFSLVTPLLREGALDRVCRWLEVLAPELKGDEVSFNDWGLLFWARQRGLELGLCAGRLLGRQRRDPRLVSMASGSCPAEADALRGSLWDDPAALSLLTELAVTRMELDLLLQGTRKPKLPTGMGLSVCGPWIPVTLSPSCPWSPDPLRCPRLCASLLPAVLWNEEDSAPLWSRGNTLFAKNPLLPSDSALAELGADRLLWSEQVPG